MVRALSWDRVVGTRFLAPMEHSIAVTAWILGRGLNVSQPYSERCEIEDGQVVACELVKAGCGPAELLEPAEEAFDAVALPVELWRNHTFILDVTAGWNVGRATGSGNESN